ncbi:MAG TPA: FAD-binding oxidoreductase [Ideonella sp.]|nr:FAD-binding oxidoreductase [Ideonella sp.]
MLTLAPLSTMAAPPQFVSNVTQLYPVRVSRIERPTSSAAVAAAVRAWPSKVAVGGGCYSMGGQVAIAGGLHLDMRQMNGLVWVRPADKAVRVQAGMRWRDLQDVLDPLGLAVKLMQSYANFTIGGAVSVNAHGRYVGRGPVGNSVRAVQLVCADGSLVEASRTQNTTLFRAALGGYGAVGVITEVELDLADNVRIERTVEAVALERYVEFFDKVVLADPRSVLHNANLLPPHFDTPTAVTWRTTDKALTEPARLVPRDDGYALQRSLIWAVTELPGGQTIRKSVVQPLLEEGPAVKWLNHEASLDVAELEPASRRHSTYVLQEYFVPRLAVTVFCQAMAKTLRSHRVNALNVSLRHSPADTLSLMPWARTDVFCFVLYYKQDTTAEACSAVGRWTRELIAHALESGGRYYLPYQLHATASQFERAYPEVASLRALKKQVDPGGKFSNTMWARYL